MGFKVAQLKYNGNTYTDAYGRIGKLSLDNGNKRGVYSIDLFSDKEGTNKIFTIKDRWCKIEAGTDNIAQCYAAMYVDITNIKAQIANMVATIDAISNEANPNMTSKYMWEHRLDAISKEEILKLDGSTEWQ